MNLFREERQRRTVFWGIQKKIKLFSNSGRGEPERDEAKGIRFILTIYQKKGKWKNNLNHSREERQRRTAVWGIYFLISTLKIDVLSRARIIFFEEKNHPHNFNKGIKFEFFVFPKLNFFLKIFKYENFFPFINLTHIPQSPYTRFFLFCFRQKRIDNIFLGAFHEKIPTFWNSHIDSRCLFW